ncbi:hypothetical protein AX14_003005 [Amanita brunnescens Koide BX004]|nr:hypothetical protein AX14_003005 [Amanita brunnescens Koide BX004]
MIYGICKYPEKRLKSTTLGIIAAPPFIAALGWLWQEKVHISVICVTGSSASGYVWPISWIQIRAAHL